MTKNYNTWTTKQIRAAVECYVKHPKLTIRQLVEHNVEWKLWPQCTESALAAKISDARRRGMLVDGKPIPRRLVARRTKWTTKQMRLGAKLYAENPDKPIREILDEYKCAFTGITERGFTMMLNRARKLQIKVKDDAIPVRPGKPRKLKPLEHEYLRHLWNDPSVTVAQICKRFGWNDPQSARAYVSKYRREGHFDKRKPGPRKGKTNGC